MNKYKKIIIGLYLLLKVGFLSIIFHWNFKIEIAIALGLIVVVVGTIISVIYSYVYLGFIEWSHRRKFGYKPENPVHGIFNEVFQEVYRKAKNVDPNLRDDVRFFVHHYKGISAFAFGKSTITISDACLKLKVNEVKAVLAHEMGHVANQDSFFRVLISYTNNIAILLATLFTIVSFANDFNSGQISEVMDVLKYVYIILANIVGLFALEEFYRRVLIYLVFRKGEYMADEFSCKCGFGKELENVIAMCDQPVPFLTNIFRYHPRPQDRIMRVRTWLKNYKKVVL